VDARELHVWLQLDVDGRPIHLLSKHHLDIHHLQNGEEAFVALKKKNVVNVLAYLYTPFLENRPFAMI
jgi:hypothetical protein